MLLLRKGIKTNWIVLTVLLIFSLLIGGIGSPLPIMAAETTITSISSQQSYTLALKSDGTVLAWGDNYYGTLGNNSNDIDKTPNQVIGLRDVVSIAAGLDNSFAVRQDGTLWAWGYRYGYVPKQVEGLTDVKMVSANGAYSGSYHVLALKNDGTVWAWGSNWLKTVGTATFEQEIIPVQVPELTDIVAIATGGTHAMALKRDGTVWAWGGNGNGQLGDGSTTSFRNTPVQVTGLTEIVKIEAGYQFSMALDKDGRVWTWGENHFGQLGDGTTTNRLLPVQLIDLTNITDLSGGTNHSLALKSDGTVLAWGNNGYGELGDGSKTDSLIPVTVKGLTDVEQINAGADSSIALKKDGTVWSWGSNRFLALGIGLGSEQTLPVQNLADKSPFPPSINMVYPNEKSPTYNQLAQATLMMSTSIDPSTVNSSNVTLLDGGGEIVPASIEMEDSHTIVLKPQFPLNPNMPYTLKLEHLKDLNGLEMFEGTRSNIKITPSLRPTETILVAGGYHTLDLYNDGVYAWGDNTFGQLGDNTEISHYTPTLVPNLRNIANLTAGRFFSAALKNDGTVWTWGRNESNQLGDGTAQTRLVPVQVQGLSDVTAISAGGSHMLTLKKDGTVWAWGNNSQGQLGDGSKINQAQPVQVIGLSDIISIAAGGAHNIALKADGTLWAWGDNAKGQLGDGSTEDRQTPTQIQGMTGINGITAGFNFSLARTFDGTVWVWGDNQFGQGGTAAAGSNSITKPIQVAGLSQIKEIRAGSSFGLALDLQNNLWTWGNNSLDQLGANLEGYSSPTPVKILSQAYVFAGGAAHGVALSFGDLFAWGYNEQGQVGKGLTEHMPLPQKISLTNEPVYYRLAGSDRYTTAIQVSQEAWNYGSDAVVLARADNFPDALAGTPLAHALNAPILLTDSQTLTPQTQEEIERLQPKSIFILGGSGAISDRIETDLSKKYDVTRLGGSDRYSTAATIASYLLTNKLSIQGKAVIAYGENFPDALAVSSLAAYEHIPILLTEKDQLPTPTADILNQLNVTETFVVGGTGVISEQVASQLSGVTRYGGSDRYQTAIQIAQGMGADPTTIFVATGENFPDALAGSVFASKTKSPIILVDNQVNSNVQTYLNQIQGKNKVGFVLGGSGVVSDYAVLDFLELLFPNYFNY